MNLESEETTNTERDTMTRTQKIQSLRTGQVYRVGDMAGSHAIVAIRNGGFRITAVAPASEGYCDDFGSWNCGCALQGTPHTHKAVETHWADKAAAYVDAARAGDLSEFTIADGPI